MAINKINFDGTEIEIPRKTSQLENDSGFVTETSLSEKGYATTTELESTTNATLDSAKTYADEKVANLVGTAPETLDTLQEVATAIQENETVVDALNSAIGSKASQTALNETNAKVDGKVDITVTDSDNNFASNPEITSNFLRKGLGFLVKVTSDGFGDEYQLGYGVGDGSVGNSLGKFQVLKYPESGGSYVASITPSSIVLRDYDGPSVYHYDHQIDQYGYHLALTYSGTSSSVDPNTVHHMTRDGYWINEDSGHGSVTMSGTGLNKTGVLIQDVWLKKDSSGNLTWNGSIMAKQSDIPSVPTDYVNLSSEQTVDGNKTFTGAIIVPDVTIT